MKNKCYCNDNCIKDYDESKAMYSIDYDSLIEQLENTRDEIDSVIKILYNKKEKDSVINQILSYEDDTETSDNEDSKMDDILDTLRQIQKDKQKFPNFYYWWYPYYRYPTYYTTTTNNSNMRYKF